MAVRPEIVAAVIAAIAALEGRAPSPGSVSVRPAPSGPSLWALAGRLEQMRRGERS